MKRRNLREWWRGHAPLVRNAAHRRSRVVAGAGAARAATPSAGSHSRADGGVVGKARIAYIVSMFPALSETFILREILELRRRGVEVDIFSLKPCSDALVHPGARELVEEGRVRYASPWRGLLRFARLFLAQPATVLKVMGDFRASFTGSGMSLAKSFTSMVLAADLIPVLREQGVTHIHAPWATYPSTAAWFCSRLAGFSFSFTARAHDLFLEDHGIGVKLREARFTQTITEYNRSLIRRRYPSPEPTSLHVIHSALDLSDFPARRDPVQPALLLSIGRMVEMKGFTDLIEACALLRDRKVAFQCLIIGKGPLLRDLSRQVEQSGLSDCISIQAPVPQAEIRRLLSQATCFVLPCVTASDGDQDGIPNVLMEAMAARVPVVSCPTSGVHELVQHGRTGLLAEPRNPHSLAYQIRRLLFDEELRGRLSEAGRLKVEDEFNIRKNAARLAELFPAG
jgi:glycosyltransferase involved in cell wall biosynthesis